MKISKVSQLTGHNAAIFSLVAATDDHHVFSGAGDAWVVEWDLNQPDLGKLVAKVEAQVFSLCFLPDKNKLLAGNMNGGLHWINLADPSSTKNIAHHSKGIFDIKSINQQVITIGGDGKLSKWDINSMRPLESYQLSNQSLRCCCYSEKRQEIAVGSSDGHIYFLDAETLDLRKILSNAHSSSVFSLQYAPDGTHLFSGGRDAILNVWDLTRDLEKISSQPAHWYTINSIAFSPDGQFFATSSRDKTVKVWDAQNFELVKVLEGGRDGGHFNSVNKVLWLKSGLLSCSDDRTIIHWREEG